MQYIHTEGWERKRSKCIKLKKHLDLFRSHLSNYIKWGGKIIDVYTRSMLFLNHFNICSIQVGNKANKYAYPAVTDSD